VSEQGRARPNLVKGVLWAMFAQAAVITAIIVPAHILVQGVLGPMGVVPYIDHRYTTFAAALMNWLVKLYLFVLFSTSFFVAGHRLSYLLPDLGVPGGKRYLSPVMYGLAAVGTVAAVYVLLTTP
jgi:fumarate reductase subunit D